MTADNVIELSNDIDQLDDEFNKWSSTLTYDQQKRSNDACMMIYGCDNITLYKRVRADLESEQNEMVEEASIVFDQPEDDDHEEETLQQKIQKSLAYLNSDSNIVIFIDYPVPQTRAELDRIYQKFNTEITQDRRILSDNYQLEIWGKTVEDMYRYLLSKCPDDDIIPVNKDNLLEHYEEMYENADPLRKEWLKIDTIQTADRTFYENGNLESFSEMESKEFDWNDSVPFVTPYLTFEEFCKYNEEIGIKDLTPCSYIFIEDGYGYYNTVKKLQECKDEKKQLELGWNPGVPISEDTMKHARSRQVNYLNENNKIQIIDVSNLNTNLDDSLLERSSEYEGLIDTRFLLKPVYIVLSYSDTMFGKIINKVKKSEYSHAAISFDTSLDNLYTFNFQPKDKTYGFTKESIKSYNDKNGDAKLMVNTIFVPAEAWKKMKETLQYYIDNANKTLYGFGNLLNIVFNKAKDSANSLYMVCSQFVDNLLKSCNIDLTGKSSNLVAPVDFEKPDEGSKVFTVFKGNKSSYKKREVDRRVKALEKANSVRDLNILEVAQLQDFLHQMLIENFFLAESDNDIAKEALVNIRQLLTVTPSIVPVKEMKTPVRFTDVGDLAIDLPKNIQREYEEAHKLLHMYDISNINGIKHEVARLFYLNSILEKKMEKVAKKDRNQYKELVNIRARVLNDYTTYFKVIKSAEPDFDFMEYLKGTEYYNKTIVVDGATLKYSGAYIKKAIQLLKQI